jgi:hypothetical protein
MNSNVNPNLINELNQLFEQMGAPMRVGYRVRRPRRQRPQAEIDTRNNDICANAIGKHMRIRTGKNQVMTGYIVSAEMVGNGRASVTLESENRAGNKVKHGPYTVSRLPR